MTVGAGPAQNFMPVLLIISLDRLRVLKAIFLKSGCQLSIYFVKNIGNDSACFLMGTIFLVIVITRPRLLMMIIVRVRRRSLRTSAIIAIVS